MKEYVTITSNNEEIIKIIEEKYNDPCFNLERKGKNTIEIVNREGCTNLQLENITREKRGILIMAQYRLEGEDCSKIYEINYMNGKHHTFDIKIQYNIRYLLDHIELIEETKEGLKDKIFDEVREFYKKIDTVKRNGIGDFIINNNADKEVKVEFKKEELKVAVSKIGNEITLEKVEKLEGSNS